MKKREKVVAIYIRTNNKDEESTHSIINQLSNINYYLKNNNINGNREYYIDAGYGGNNLERPEFNRLIKNIENQKVDLIVADKLSVIGRNINFMGFIDFLEQHKINLISVREEYNLNKFLQERPKMMKMMDEWYKTDLSARKRQRKNNIR